MLGDEVVREDEKLFDHYHRTIQHGLGEGCIKPYPIELIGNLFYQDVVAVMVVISDQPDPE